MRDQRDVAEKLGGILFHEKALPIQLGFAARFINKSGF
jgi:hypothetical protein